MEPGHLRGKGHKIQLPKLPGRWKGLSRDSHEAAPPSAGSKLPLLRPAAPPFSLGLPCLFPRGSPPTAVVPNTVCGSALDACRAAGKTSPWDEPKGPVPLKLCVWSGSLGHSHESPLCTNPMQRMKCVEPCLVQTPYFLWEKLSGQAGRQGAGLRPWWNQSRRVPSSASLPSAPSRPRDSLEGVGPLGRTSPWLRSQGCACPGTPAALLLPSPLLRSRQDGPGLCV